MRRTLILSLVATSLCMTACATGDEADDQSLQFRQQDHIFDELGIYLGENSDDEEMLVWEIEADHAFLGPASDGNLVMSFTETEIQDLDGFVVCEREHRKLVDVVTPEGEDEIVLSVLGPFIFAGELHFRNKTPGQVKLMLNEQLLYTVKRDQVFDGKLRNHNVLLTATDRIRDGGRMGMLVVGALAAGECGSDGLD